MSRLLAWRWGLVPALAGLGAVVGLLVALLGSSERRAEAAVLVSSPKGVPAVQPLLPDVRELATSSVLAGNVRSTLRIPGPDERFRRRLGASIRPNAQVVVVSATDRNADRARQIAQEAAVVLTQLVAARFGKGTPPLQAAVLDPAHVVSSAKRHVARDALLGAGFGLLAAFATLSVLGREVLPADIRSAERGLAEREGLVERRVKLITQRELALARGVAELAVQRRALAEAEPGGPETAPAAASPTPAAPPQEPSPAREAPPAFRAQGRGRWNVNELERFVETRRDASPETVSDWRTYLFFLREHAAVDGTLPDSFDALVSEVFAELAAEGLSSPPPEGGAGSDELGRHGR